MTSEARARLERVLDSTGTVYAASGITLALGLVFIFVWAPHPWGWSGFDRYDTLAWSLARGEPFATLEVPWGYAYFVALFYRLFGHHPAVPLVVQAVLNAALPFIVWIWARTWLDSRMSILAAALTGLFSFNTVYASTLSSDALCTVVFMLAVATFSAAQRTGRPAWYVATGLLTGLAAQLRPNLIFVPLMLGLYDVVHRPRFRRAGGAVALVVAAAVALAPWMVRNYRLTGVALPTSVHGGVQLWYGSLQVGPYLNSRAHNPRRVFEDSVFDYTSLDWLPLIVTAHVNACGRPWPSATSLVYWTDHDPEPRRLNAPGLRGDGAIMFQVPPTGGEAAVYYYFDTRWIREDAELHRTTPDEGGAAPLVYFVSRNHLGDLDVHGDLLDIFDVLRIARHQAWSEPIPHERRLRAAGIGPDGLETAVEILARGALRHPPPPPLVAAIRHEPNRVSIELRDGSTIVIPRAWKERITDAAFDGDLAGALMPSRVRLDSLALISSAPPSDTADRDARPAMVDGARGCPTVEEIGINRVFYRREPDMMRRYFALADDNIRRDPGAFVRASLYRVLRVFVIEGSSDRSTTQQFRAASVIYAAATAASATYLLLFVAGVMVAWRRGYALGAPLLLIAYVPVTIAPLLTNMRYSITVQPLMLTFIAVAMAAALERTRLVRPRPAGAAAGFDRAGT